MGIIPNLGFLKLDSSGFMILVLSANCVKALSFWIHETSAQYKLCRKTFTLSTMSHMSSKKHSNAASQSSRGSASKGQMQLTSYLWKKIGMLWKSYGISFLEICTNPDYIKPVLVAQAFSKPPDFSIVVVSINPFNVV